MSARASNVRMRCARIIWPILLGCTGLYSWVPANSAPLTESVRSTVLSGTGVSGSGARVLLVDDDESDDNNAPGDTRLSTSDVFYRTMLKDAGLDYDIAVVPHYGNGPTAAELRKYRLVIWYTGSCYGGNPDNTGVTSKTDESSLRDYLAGGGVVILISPGLLNNAEGATGTWDKSASKFVTDVIGARGSKAFLSRYREGKVTANDGQSFSMPNLHDPETQIGGLNPAGASTLFWSELSLDGKKTKSVSVATSHSVGAGRMVYVGFTFENIATNADGAFGKLLQAAGISSLSAKANATRSLTTPALSLIGAGPTSTVTAPALSLIGAGPAAAVTAPQLTLIGAGPASAVTVPALSLIGAGPTATVTAPRLTLIGSGPVPKVTTPPLSLVGSDALRKPMIPKSFGNQ